MGGLWFSIVMGGRWWFSAEIVLGVLWWFSAEIVMGGLWCFSAEIRHEWVVVVQC